MTEAESNLLALRVNGFCVLENVIPGDSCRTIVDRIQSVIAKHGDRYPAITAGVRFIPGFINFDQSFARYLTDDRLIALVHALLGNHPRISFTTAIVNQPGNDRGGWHADWPYNQKNAGHLPAPYPDAPMHLTSLWMLTPFRRENGGTLVLPGSHRERTNPTDVRSGLDPATRFPGEQIVEGAEGSVLLFDSRLWHATSPNRSTAPRTALAVRYAPWWLNLEILRPGSEDRRRMVDEPGFRENEVPSVDRAVFDTLPKELQPLYRHWIT